MLIKGITEEDFTNYIKPCLFIASPTCNFKCCRDCGEDVCQNMDLVKADALDVDIDKLCARYVSNPITHSVVFGGLEPFDSIDDVISFIYCLRNDYDCLDDVVIYTGYNKDEIEASVLDKLKEYGNIIIKWGRFIPNQTSHFDSILGVELMSNNQYAERLEE